MTQPPPWQRVRRTLREVAALLAIMGGVAFVGGGLLFILIQELQTVALMVVGVGAVLLALAGAASFVQVRAAIAARRGRYTTNAVIVVTSFTAITILLAFISFRNSARWDATATKQFTLAPQTLKVLQELPEPVKATAFFVPTEEEQRPLRQAADDLLFAFKQRSQGKVTYRFVDPEADPSVARQLDVKEYPSIVFQSEGSKRQKLVKAPPVTEQDFASALLTVTGTKQKKAYFLTGHSEKDINDVTEGTAGYGFAARSIVADNYEIGTINLFKEKKFPDDVAILVVASPRGDLLSDEVPLLIEWLKDGGRALFIFDPNPPKSFLQLLSLWGIEIPDGTVVDAKSSVIGDPRTV
ncbi:MAG: GldG family protein, partial [Chloroflexi bacterium]|nr:GldG family protein [Chloroflexota bacterium]